MMQRSKNMSHHESGFSLVELAIALMVIGLLLAGVMRGRELIDNARGSRLITQVKQYEAAALAFKNVYGSLPGDIMDAGGRVPGCNSAPCNYAGDGNGVIGLLYGDSMAAGWGVVNASATSENRPVWIQLSRAGLISSIDNSYTGTPLTPGQDYPESPWRGVAYDVYYWNDTSPHTILPAHYIKTKSGPLNSVSTPFLTPSIVAQIDRKVDDGFPLTGRVVGWAGTGECYSPSLVSNRYSTIETSRCELSMRLDF